MLDRMEEYNEGGEQLLHHLSLQTIDPGRIVEFDHVNHNGLSEHRLVKVLGLQFGVVKPYYIEPTFLLSCWCTTRRAFRSFDLNKISNLKVIV